MGLITLDAGRAVPGHASAEAAVALESTGINVRKPIPRKGSIRRCRVRHVSIVPDGGDRRVQVDCLLGGREHPLPLGTMDEAREICNACTATTIWRADED
jgi:hypothetical protein